MKDYCRIEDLTFRYFKDSDRNVLEHVNLSFSQGEVTVILGNSGCGKSTLAAVLCGLYPENAGYLENGRIVIDGQDMKQMPFHERCRYTVQMFQNPDLQFCMNNLREEMLFCLENIQTPREKMLGKPEKIAELYGVGKLLDRPFSNLSGGEKQRAALCCLLILNPRIMVLDEPFANLDDEAAAMYMEVLKKKIREEKTTIIAIDHRPDSWMEVADRFLILGEKGQAVRENITPGQIREEQALFEEQGLYFSFGEVKRKEKDPAKAKAEPVIRFTGTSIRHKKSKEILLENVNLTARRGEVIACLGPSGEGKTTLFHTLLGQKKYTGSVKVAGKEVAKQREKRLFSKIGLVFQNPANQFVTTMVQQEVMKSLMTWKHMTEEEAAREALPLLEDYGLRPFRKFSPFMLSQGQQRRLGVLTMLAGGQEILLLDEPTYGQDGNNTKAIMEQITAQAGRGVTVVFSTHDRNLAKKYADRFWIVEGGTAHEED